MSTTNTRQAKRTPVTLKIKFKSETLSQFIDRYSVDISAGGIFIRTREPLPVGTSLRFEFQLRDSSPLITGDGTVVWIRSKDPNRPGVATGMGVRFDKVTPKSRQVLSKILADKAGKSAPIRMAEPDPLDDKAEQTRVAPSDVIRELARSTQRPLARDSDDTPLPRPVPFHASAAELAEAEEDATEVRTRGQIEDWAQSNARRAGTQHEVDLLEIDENFLAESANKETSAPEKPGKADKPPTKITTRGIQAEKPLSIPSLRSHLDANKPRVRNDTTPTPPPEVVDDAATSARQRARDTATSLGPAPAPDRPASSPIVELASQQAPRDAGGPQPAARPTSSGPAGKAANLSGQGVERDEGSKLISLSMMPPDEDDDSLASLDPVDATALGAPILKKAGAADESDESDEKIAAYRKERELKKQQAHERKVKTVVEAAQDPLRQAAKQRFLNEQLAIAGADVLGQNAPSPAAPARRRIHGAWIVAGVAIVCITIASTVIVVVRRGGGEEPNNRVVTPTTQDRRDKKKVPTGAASVSIHVTPKGSRVELLGTGKYGPAPIDFRGLDDNGTYKVRVERAGYANREIVVTASATDFEPVVLELVPLGRTVKIKTTPAGAAITINDIKLPQATPAKLKLTGKLATAEELAIVLKKDGFLPVFVPVTVSESFREEAGSMHYAIEETLQQDN